MQFFRKPIENFKSRSRITNDLSCRVSNEYACRGNLLYVHVKYVEVFELYIKLTENFLYLRAPWKLLDASRTVDFWAQGSWHHAQRQIAKSRGISRHSSFGSPTLTAFEYLSTIILIPEMSLLCNRRSKPAPILDDWRVSQNSWKGASPWSEVVNKLHLTVQSYE